MQPQRTDRYAFLPGTQRPVRIARAEGCTLFTPEGDRILDAAGGAIVANIGHGRTEVVEAAAAALQEVTYAVPPFVTEARLRLAERLQEHWLPDGVSRCAFASGGSESVDLALRIARQHFVSKGEPARYKVIGRHLSYHGTTLSGLDVADHPKRRPALGPWLHDWPKAPACYALRCDACRTAGACTLDCADGFEAAIQAADPETVAAVIVEPIGGSTAGALVPPPGYLERVAEICRRHGILWIADEVMTGFGRTGARFAVDHEGVAPDLLVGGKGLAGGYAPIGGVYASEAVTEPIAAAGDEVMFYTFAAHPSACAAADKVLEILAREALVERAARMGEALTERLQAELGDHPHVAEIRGRGLLQAVELVQDRASGHPFPREANLTARVVAAGLRNGVFFYPGGAGAAQDVVCLGPPFIVTEDELDLIATALAKAIDAGVARASR
ncbi:MAG: aminotransferase class III-fold pyridoxal phosphate-dependent enzyme [Proteobacteria bacterium]|nr:aminotransferase class III-fold pyridoxal phosphate-dependent enzyme [Pseudomonadota bacterium]